MFSLLTGNIGNFIMLLTAISAFGVYFWTKFDTKRNAARIILMEIRRAERVIFQIKKTEQIDELSPILPTNNWKKYNHLFVKNFDQDELELINNFYAKAEVAENLRLRHLNFDCLSQEEKTKHAQRCIMDFVKNSAVDNLDNASQVQRDFEHFKKIFLPIIHEEKYGFAAYSPMNKLIKFINVLDLVTTTTAGEKVKAIAQIK